MHSFAIGTVTVAPPLVLAPMAGATDHSFRLLAKEQGCGLVYSEMISAKGLIYGGGGGSGNGRSSGRHGPLLFFDQAERPLAFQIFGSDPALMAEAACRLEEHGADLIDLNFGCPARKVIRNGEGGALLRKPELCREIMGAVVRAVRCPVTVKLRSGWDQDSINALRVAALAVEAGVQAITLHGRTVRQGFAGAADWNLVRQVAAAVQVPLIGSGDLLTPEQCVALLRSSGCAAVMIGRAALGNPWIFSRARACLAGGPDPGPPAPKEFAETVLRHFDLLCRLKGERVGVREMRRHACYYFRGRPGAATWRKRLLRAVSREEMAALLGAATAGNGSRG